VSQNDPFSYFLNYSLKNQLISIIFADISKLRETNQNVRKNVVKLKLLMHIAENITVSRSNSL